jgi:hypothetical protein
MTRLDLPFLASTIFGAPHMIRQGKMAAILDVIMPRLAGGVKLPVAAMTARTSAPSGNSTPLIGASR